MASTAPALAVLFLLPALSLSGLPPLSGFVGKFALVDAGVAAGRYTIVGVSLAVSLLTLFSMVKIWSGVFWSPAREPPDGRPHDPGRIGGPVLMVLPTVARHKRRHNRSRRNVACVGRNRKRARPLLPAKAGEGKRDAPLAGSFVLEPAPHGA